MPRTTAVLAAALILGATTASPAAAAPQQPTAQVVVFSLEVTPLRTYENPDGCQKLPIAAHVLVNLTDRIVRTYADPFCMAPTLTVRPDYGAHVVPGTGSFQLG